MAASKGGGTKIRIEVRKKKALKKKSLTAATEHEWLFFKSSKVVLLLFLFVPLLEFAKAEKSLTRKPFLNSFY